MPFADRNYTYADSPASLFPHLVGLPDEKFGQTPEDVNCPNAEQYPSTRYRFDNSTGSMAVDREAYPILPFSGGAKKDDGYLFNIIEREGREDRFISTLPDHIHQAPACSSIIDKEGAGPTAANTSIAHERGRGLANPAAHEKSDKQSYTSTFHEGSRPVEAVTIPKQSHPIYTPTFQNRPENAALVPHPIPLKDLLLAEPSPSPPLPPVSISKHPQDTAAAAAAPEELPAPVPPTPAERLATYARYVSSPQHISRGDLRAWFEITYQKPLTDSQASSIIHTRGMVPRAYTSNRKHVPKPNLTYDAALERERAVLYEYTLSITRAEGRAPPMTRVAKWWAEHDGGRLLASTSIAGLVAEMRKRGGQAMAVEAAKSQGKKWAGEWEAMDLTSRKEFVKAGMKRAHEAEGDGEVDLTGPWCKPGDEAEEAKEDVGRKRHRSELAGGAKFRGEGRRVMIKAPQPLQREGGGDKYPHVSFKLWNWWRKHRDSRRISTADLQRRAGLFWASLGDGNDPMPDFTDYIEWFKNRYQLVTNEGGPYMADMIYMYDFLGTDLPMRPPNRSQTSKARRWC